MAREYRHIQQYEKELLDLKEKGWTVKAIGERYGLSYEQIHGFFKRCNRNKKKLSEGVKIDGRGRPRKEGAALPPSVQKLSKLIQLQYELAMKERHIKRLEMENKLMRDFLSLTERK
ncbi:MAG: hypothetical protein IJB92_07960 [Clostridia bacterium]|nr:hypothetical protein [Clostridia bacterium]MBQ4638654.1 hypothetical protein [Clostridia bacterium]